MNRQKYDLIVIGAGAAGMMAAITAARKGKKVLLLEKLSGVAAKLKATGGGRCNLTNTLSDEEFMKRFGRDGRFMQDALGHLNHKDLQDFFAFIGVATHAPDGYRIFPIDHNSATIIQALKNELERLHVTLLCEQKVEHILERDGAVKGVTTITQSFEAPYVILATGGLGYPVLGAEGDGYAMACEVGHKVTALHPAMMPLRTKEEWVKNCKADTISKVELRVALPKYKKLRAYGDLIFTNSGIRGPVVLDFARDVTPLIDKYKEVPILLNLTKGMHEDALLKHLKNEALNNADATLLELVKTLLPEPLAREICIMSGVDTQSKFSKISGAQKEQLLKNLAWTPLHVNGHDGFKMAMITRGGIELKEINPKTMQSKIIKGLYFCGEVMNIDGPCGGYNLQWSFSSGALAGELFE
jgi:hypothetical protein